jgi:anaerobic ribonucleoside-triphosphate reductase activating protein
MSNQNNYLMNISVLYRYTQKYFDSNLAPYGLGSGQMIFLLLINEHEGLTSQQLTALGDFDKGTTSKSLQKLIEQGYVEYRVDEEDKRVKRIYTTKKASEIINALYQIRNDCASQLDKGLSDAEADEFQSRLQVVTNNARGLAPEVSYTTLKIGGLQKLTLLDYPGNLACTVFTAGCNLKCPFCHNRDLVFIPENFEYIDPDEVIALLKKRQGMLEGVCITGGEPLLQDGLLDFIQEIKELGYLVKLDTNGCFPKKLKEAVETGMIDYVAMDVKNCLAKYPQTAGIPEISFRKDAVRESIDYLMSGPVDYEFRTTVVRELHTAEDLVALAKEIQGAKRYYLQQFKDSGRCIEEGYTAYSDQEMKGLLKQVRTILPQAELRGVN